MAARCRVLDRSAQTLHVSSRFGRSLRPPDDPAAGDTRLGEPGPGRGATPLFGSVVTLSRKSASSRGTVETVRDRPPTAGDCGTFAVSLAPGARSRVFGASASLV